jgi:hypothetical protein
MEQRPKKLMKQVQDAIRLKHYSFLAGCVMVGVGLFGVASFLM